MTGTALAAPEASACRPASGWLHLPSGAFVGTPRGHTPALLADPATFGFASRDDLLAASEYGRSRTPDGRPIRLADRPLVELEGLLDGDEGIWRTLYDRGWIRIVRERDGAALGIVVQDDRTARETVRLLGERFGDCPVSVDIYDRATERVLAAYRLDGDAAEAFLRCGRLLPRWRSGT